MSLGQRLAAGRLRQIEADRALVAVDAYVVGGIAVMKRRSPIADLVAHRRLELDDVGAVIRKQLCREGPPKYAREVDDLHAGKSATPRVDACCSIPCFGHFSPWCTDAFSTHSVPQVCPGGNGRRRCAGLPANFLIVVGSVCERFTTTYHALRTTSACGRVR